MQRVLITGAGGGIGRSLRETLRGVGFRMPARGDLSARAEGSAHRALRQLTAPKSTEPILPLQHAWIGG